MPKRLTAMRLSVYTEEQLETLATRFGMNKTEIIQLAIDRLYQAEIVGSAAQSAVEPREREQKS